MVLIPDSIKDGWGNYATQLSEKDGGLGVFCRLFFDSGFSITNNVQSDPIGNKPGVGLNFGGIGYPINEAGHNTTDLSSPSGLVQTTVTKDIQGRVRPITKPYDRMSMALEKNQNVWQLNTVSENLEDIERANYAIFHIEEHNAGKKTIKVKLFRPPEIYGLGGGQMCRSFWEQT